MDRTSLGLLKPTFLAGKSLVSWFREFGSHFSGFARPRADQRSLGFDSQKLGLHVPGWPEPPSEQRKLRRISITRLQNALAHLSCAKKSFASQIFYVLRIQEPATSMRRTCQRKHILEPAASGRRRTSLRQLLRLTATGQMQKSATALRRICQR